jgi:hypothetical protein
LAFIDFPSWSRGSRPYSLVRRERIPQASARFNLSAGTLAAKGTTWDYLTYLSAFPVQIMASEWVFGGVVKAEKAGFANLSRLNAPGGGAVAPAR